MHRREQRDPRDLPIPLLRAPGAQLLGSPRFVPVFYPGDVDRDVLEGVAQRLGQSAFWAHASEYGVGAASASAAVVLSDAPPARLSEAAVAAALKAELERPGLLLPAPDDGTIYVLFYPPGTTITLPVSGGEWESCNQFGAYHNSVRLASGRRVAVAVIPRCTAYNGLSGLDPATSALSHEAIEAATDPFGLGYDDTDWNGSGWSYTIEQDIGAEVADFCEFQADPNIKDSELGVVVQRYYSNQAAAAHHDPCVPALHRPYFNAVARVPGATVGPSIWTKGVPIPPGGEATIAVELFADGPVGEWDLSAEEIGNPHLPPEAHHQLSFSFDRPRGRAGDVRHLTIRRSALPPGTQALGLPFAIVSTQGSVRNVWPTVVGQ